VGGAPCPAASSELFAALADGPGSGPAPGGDPAWTARSPRR